MQNFGDFEIVKEIGRGGMGVVYEANQRSLSRRVALKVLPPGLELTKRAVTRFRREAEAAARLRHSHIVPIYATGYEEGIPYYAMELIEGPSLDQVISGMRATQDRISPKGKLNQGQTEDQPDPINSWAEETLGVEPRAGSSVVSASSGFGQPDASSSRSSVGRYFDTVATMMADVASALAHAHDKGVIHRDIKPSNLMLSPDGRVCVNDFGLARILEREGLTISGEMMGSPMYMSPEQVAAGRVRIDHRTDIYSTGATLYELLTLQPPYHKGSRDQILSQIVHKEPARPRRINRRIPEDLETICLKSMDKDPDQRYQTAEQMADDLRRWVNRRAISARRVGPFGRIARWSRRHPGMATAFSAVCALLLLVGILFRQGYIERSKSRSLEQLQLGLIAVEDEYIPERRWDRAFEFLERAHSEFPRNKKVKDLLSLVTVTWTVTTDTPCDAVYVKSYGDSVEKWRNMGPAPTTFEIPRGHYVWKIVLEDRVQAEGCAGPADVQLTRQFHGIEPPQKGMVRVWVDNSDSHEISTFDIDRLEVTNREFMRFVNDRGYTDSRYWSHLRFVDGGREIGWTDAVNGFRDSTGSFGPKSWLNGSFPPGQEDRPVTGVSWYEAAAYAKWANKELPTVQHWIMACGLSSYEQIVQESNFSDERIAPAGEFKGISRCGSYDMAGNAREWCWNEMSGGARAVSGGSFRELGKMYQTLDSRPPADRSVETGFRCAVYPHPVAESLRDPIGLDHREYSRGQLSSDAEFEVLKSQYIYDKVQIVATQETSRDTDLFRELMITFEVPHVPSEHQPMMAHLFLPKNAMPPFQTVVYFPGAGSFRSTQFPTDEQDLAHVIGLVQHGRAVVWPVYESMYDRGGGATVDFFRRSSTQRRDVKIRHFKDMATTLDCLETRNDIDLERIAYFGFSVGGEYGIRLVSLEPRIKTAVFLSGCLTWRDYKPLPVVDDFQFVPRLTTPFLLLMGEHEVAFPLETCQRPFLDFVGTPETEIRHTIVPNAGHYLPKKVVTDEVRMWLDRYLGPVGRQSREPNGTVSRTGQ